MKKVLSEIIEIAKTVVVVVLLAFFIRYFIFQPFVVDGNSMQPTFTNNEYILVNKLSYRIKQPERGDVIVFESPTSPGVDYIKRIIGLPGETIQIRDNKIYINGKTLSEKYLSDDIKTYIKKDESVNLKISLGKDEYFVMGDNREHSSDSRIFGAMPKDNIIGKAWFVVYPWNIFGLVKQAEY